MIISNISKDTLLAPLQMVIGVVERKQTKPILANVLMEREHNRLFFTATDSEIQMTTSIELEEGIVEGDNITISAKKLLDILRILPENSQLTLDAADNKALLKANRSRFNLQTLPAADFPKLATELGHASAVVELPQNTLKRLLASVQFAMAMQDVRYYLNGMLLVLEGFQLKAVATDGHRLAYNACDINNEFEKRDLILPRKTVAELYKLLGDNDDPVTLELAAQQVKVTVGNTTLISKIIDGRFPDYKRVIPQHPSHLVLHRQALQQALQRAAILSNEKFRGIHFSINENILGISCNNSDQEEAYEELEIDYQGPATSIGFNVNYLMEGLANISEELVLFSFGDPNSSTLITTPANDAFRYVVMPMRI